MTEALIAPDVRTGLYVPLGASCSTYPRPYFLNHRLAETPERPRFVDVGELMDGGQVR